MKKLVRMIAYLVIFILLTLIVVGTAFLYLSPEFGNKSTGTRLDRIHKSPNFKSDRFQNLVTTSMDLGASGYVKMISEYMKGETERRPSWSIPVQKIDTARFSLSREDSLTSLLWFGHSAFLLEIDGKRLLLDPMFGPSPSPTPYLGTNRFNDTLPLAIDRMPHVDAIILSHDHYDHLDYGSIIRLKEKTGHFFVPLGVGAHLESWGVAPDKITELDWWEEVDFEGLKFVATPARHFSGRGLGDRMKTLWASWVIRGKTDNLFFGGDSGYFPGFKQIGDKYGPFDLTMLECGQYNKLWSEIHMMPEQTVQAHLDLKGNLLLPIHWGAFTLAMHSWTEPIERLSKSAEALSISVTTPMIGEPVVLHTSIPQTKWWQRNN